MADFIKKITDNIDKGIKTVSSKGKELIETTKLKGELKDVQNSIESRFLALGKKVFEMLNRGALNEEELRMDWKEIVFLFRKLTEIENAIKQVELEAMKVRYGGDIIMCPRCGGHNKSDAKFCMSCGSPIVKEKPEGKTCPTCGASLKEGAKFCIRCGGKIE